MLARRSEAVFRVKPTYAIEWTQAQLTGFGRAEVPASRS
jgi:hypothetical protein